MQAQASEVVSIPLEVVGGRFVVPVQAPDDAMLRFLVTTGSPQTVLARSTSERYGEDVTLRLGVLDVPASDRVVWPDADVTAGSERLDGMIGVNLLSDHDVLLDAAGGRMLIGPIGAGTRWPGVDLAAPIRLQVMHGVALLTDILIEGQRFPTLIDLGRPSLVVNSGVQTALALKDPAAVEVTIGTTTVQDVPVRMLDLDVFKMWAPGGEGVSVLGAAPFLDCAISLSWARAELRTCAR